MTPFGKWVPDSPAYGGHSTVANNCIPYNDYYAPFYSPLAYTSASGEEVLGAFAAKGSDGTPYNFVGSETLLQLVASAAFTDVSKVGGYTTGSEDRWYWTTFGNIVIASNGQAKLQAYTMGTSTDFADLHTSAPVAKYVATVRNFVFAGNISGFQNRVQWSSIENPAGDWTPSVTTQADYQDLYGDTYVGDVTQVVGGEYATVFCQNGVFRGTYVGGSLIFTFDQIVSGNGTSAPGSVAAYGQMIFFLGNDGFYRVGSDGLVPIGEGLDRTFLEEVLESDYYRISSVIDPRNNLYVVAYSTSGAVLDKMLIYNWQANKWTSVDTGNIETLFAFYSEGYTLENIDALVGNPDTGPYADVSIDSAIFQGGKPSLACVNSLHELCLFNGSAMNATLETGEVQLSPGHKSFVTKIVPMIDGANTVKVQVGSRNAIKDMVAYTSDTNVNTEGEACVFNTARYQRARVTIEGGFSKAYGIDWVAKQAGKY